MNRGFFRMGIREEMPSYVKNKVQISNYMVLVLLFIAFSYWLISAIFNPELNFIPIIGVGVVAGAGLMNYMNQTQLSRLVLATMPTALAVWYQAYLVPAGGEALTGTMLLALSFSSIAFILFDLREGAFVYVPVSCCFLLIMLFPYLRDALEMPLNDQPYRDGFLYHVTVALGFILNFVNVLVLAFINKNSDKQSENLLQQAEMQHQQMLQKEAELQKNLAELQQAQEVERQRAWAAEGFSRFGSILRKHADEQQMYDELLAGIIKYIGANQGGIYLAEGEGKEVQLVLRAAYAYERKKYRSHQVAPGQGILGQCYLERDYTYLTRIPQNYISITSGLGDAPPTVLLLVPLMTEDEVMGVLELASFKPISQHMIDFLMKLGEDIAASVQSSRINHLTRELLAKAQEQTEQMRAQEEEMRQNMEELSATQEELQRKEREYMRQIELLGGELEINNK